jgi:hypothetical protein
VERWQKLAWALILGLSLTLAVAGIAARETPGAPPKSANSGQHFFPPYGNARDRFGFDSGSLSGYDVAQLHAGWYSNWGASLNPTHPDQLVYVQLIRFHAGADPSDPAQVTVRPDRGTIARIAAAHPGSLWLMSNEPDSLYQGDPILPQVYATVYHDFYQHIKALDPTALIANGGIVQPTPCRLAYLDVVWDTYLETFGEPMPVDVWNTHAFILREVFGSWGASTPPGVDPDCGINYAIDDGDDIDILLTNIRAMRAWMKDKGYQDRPLIITEYGVLWPQWFAPQFTPLRVSHFMTRTFDLFLDTTDAELGYPADDFRLVQAWAWYSLSDDELYNGHLFDSTSKTLSLMGATYGAYTAALSDTPFADLSARLIAARIDFTPTVADAGSPRPMTFTLSLTGSASNLGRLPASAALARFEVLSGEGSAVVFSRDATYTVPARFEGVVDLQTLTTTLDVPGHYALRLGLDPEGQFGDPRPWNNVATTTLDLRPDLTPIGLSYRLVGSPVHSASLMLTATVQNLGAWSSPAVSAAVYLEWWPEGWQVERRALSIPPLAIGAEAEQAVHLTWTAPDHELYRLVFAVDGEGRLPEQQELNNQAEALVPLAVSGTLVPTRETVLTSSSGAIQIVFPAGTVRVPTEIRYTPLWPAGWETGRLQASSAAFSLTALLDDGSVPLAFARPVSVTWRYREADLTTLDEALLRLFVLTDEERWNDAACRPYQRDLHGDRLSTAICRTGRFVFGSRYDLFVPLVSHQAPLASTYTESLWPVPDSDRPRSPLLLPLP